MHQKCKVIALPGRSNDLNLILTNIHTDTQILTRSHTRSHTHTHSRPHTLAHKFTQTKNAQMTWIGSLQRRISKRLINLRRCSMSFIGGQGGGCTWNHSEIPHTHWSDSIKRWACQVWARWQDCGRASHSWSAQRTEDSEETWSTDVSNTWTMYSDNPSPTGNRNSPSKRHLQFTSWDLLCFVTWL